MQYGYKLIEYLYQGKFKHEISNYLHYYSKFKSQFNYFYLLNLLCKVYKKIVLINNSLNISSSTILDDPRKFKFEINYH